MKNKAFFITAFTLITLFILNGETGVINLAVVNIARGLSIPIGNSPWIITAYFLSFASCIIAAGRLGAMYGYYRITLIGIALFFIGQIICGASVSFFMLIIGRIFQGIGASFCVPNATGIIFSNFEKEKGLASGIIECTIGLAILIGPFYGAEVIQLFSWRIIFFIDAVIMFIMIFVFWYLTKKYNKQQDADKKIDFLGIIFLFISMSSFLYALSLISDIENSVIIFVCLVIIHIISDIIFYCVEIKSKSPLVDFSMFKECPSILQGCLIRFFLMGVVYIYTYLLGILFQERFLTPMHTALLIMPMTILMVVMSPLTGKIIDKIGIRMPAVIGAICFVISPIALYYFLPLHSTPLYFVGVILCGASYAMISTSSLSLTIRDVKTELQGFASGFFYMFSILAGSIFITISGAILKYAKANIPDQKLMLHTSFRYSMLICILLAVITFVLVLIFCRTLKKEES
jgi:MFS family permease